MHHHQKPEMRDSGNTDNGTSASAGICCGMHAICEKTGQVNDPPVYYDDEELDRFAGREPDSYSDSEIEEFRDVLLTLIPSDAPGWTVSLEKRRISLPAELKPELELILLESIPSDKSDPSDPSDPSHNSPNSPKSPKPQNGTAAI